MRKNSKTNNVFAFWQHSMESFWLIFFFNTFLLLSFPLFVGHLFVMSFQSPPTLIHWHSFYTLTYSRQWFYCLHVEIASLRQPKRKGEEEKTCLEVRVIYTAELVLCPIATNGQQNYNKKWGLGNTESMV